jgi:predicted HicB family RNase H-like nuclease
MEYKGYIGNVELDEESSLLRGELINRARLADKSHNLWVAGVLEVATHSDS